MTDLERTAALYREGLKINQIAERMGVGPKCVSRRLRKFGLTGARMQDHETRSINRHRSHTVGKSLQIPQSVLDAPRIDREPCTFCGTRADVGCRHKGLARTVWLSDIGGRPLLAEGSARAGTSPLDRPAASMERAQG